MVRREVTLLTTQAADRDLDVTDGEFKLASYQRFLAENAESIAEFRATQSAAFEAERRAWAAAGEFDPKPEPEAAQVPLVRVQAPPGGHVVEAPFAATVWRVDVRPGARAEGAQSLVTLEAMKTEQRKVEELNIPVGQWLREHGGYCDCEVAANVQSEFGDIVG